jgi:hypothetical protein
MNSQEDTLYIGNTTNCYTQAALTLFVKELSFENLMLFEIATTVPFGLIYKGADPSRILDCLIDPDEGIDHAFRLFSVQFETIYSEKGVYDVNFFKKLDCLLEQSPVLLGPIDMGELTYLPRSELYSGIDHYIVVIKKILDGYYVSDPEGEPFAYISQQQLNNACTTGLISEGRGSYTVRSASQVSNLQLSEKEFDIVFKKVADNYRIASQLSNGGARGLRLFAIDIETHFKSPSMLVGLKFVLTNRIQRSMFAKCFYEMYVNYENTGIKDKIARRLIAMQGEQQQLYAKLLYHVFDMDNAELADIKGVVENIAQLEDNISALVSDKAR